MILKTAPDRLPLPAMPRSPDLHALPGRARCAGAQGLARPRIPG